MDWAEKSGDRMTLPTLGSFGRLAGWGMDTDSSIHGFILLILSKFIILPLPRHYGTKGQNPASHGERFFYNAKPL
jgi:hypothetical protein